MQFSLKCQTNKMMEEITKLKFLIGKAYYCLGIQEETTKFADIRFFRQIFPRNS